MPTQKLQPVLSKHIKELKNKGTLKGSEHIIAAIKPASDGNGPRFILKNEKAKEFIRMNSNSYLGLSCDQQLITTEEQAARKYGVGPGAVRFISGTFMPHIELENKLANFHSKGSAMIFSSAYAAVTGVITSLVDNETVVYTDELNHNSIITAIRLANPPQKIIYKHNDMDDLTQKIKSTQQTFKRGVIITDGIFSMRGDHAPLKQISAISEKYNDKFTEGLLTIVDDSHGVGAYGETGRGTIEYTEAYNIDVIIATLGKAFGVNGGYVVSDNILVSYLRETAATYIYSNPITPAEAMTAKKALEILDSDTGKKLLKHLRGRTKQLENGLHNIGFEILKSDHPIVPLFIRDTEETKRIVTYLFNHGILATGIKYPVVPKGEEEIRFQASAMHTEKDIAYVLEILKKYKTENA